MAKVLLYNADLLLISKARYLIGEPRDVWKHTKQGEVSQVGVNEVPVDGVPEGLDVLGLVVTVVDVEGVLPHVAGQHGLQVLGERAASVVGLVHLQLVTVLHQPRPSASEVASGSSRELLLHLIERSEVSVNRVLDGAGRGTSTVGRPAKKEYGFEKIRV